MTFLAAGSQAQIDRSQQPVPGPAPKVNIGKPQTFQLKNGLKVMVVENHKLPRVSISLRMDNPPFAEGDKKGVDALTGALIGNGTSKISKEDFQEEIDFMGANITFFSSGAFASTLSRYFPRTLELLAQGMIDPRFTQEDFDDEVSRTLDGLKADEKSVQANAARVENVLVYGANHPYGEFVTEEKIKGLSLNDIKNHYSTYMIPNNSYLVITGDVKFKEVKKLVEKDFKNWKKGSLPASQYDEPKNLSKIEIDFVDMPNAVQSEVSVVNVSRLKMTDKDYFSAILANDILGGGGEARLFLNLREANGFTYGSYSRIAGSKYVGKFKAFAQVRNEVTDSAIVELMKEINHIRTAPVTAEELKNAKAKLIGNFVMGVEKPQTVANMALNSEIQELPGDFYENYIRNINGVTLAEVQAAAQKYFSYDNARILVVGKASEVLPGLERLGYPIHYFDRFGAPASKPEQKAVAADISVQSVLDSYITAIGGDKVKTITSMEADYTAEVQGMPLAVKSISVDSGKSMTEISGMGMVLQKVVFDGENGYNEAQGQKVPMTEEEIEAHKVSAVPFPELNMGAQPGIKLGAIENFNGKDCYVLIDGDTSTYYAVESGLKMGSASKFEAQGQSGVQTIYFNDYKDFEGILIPSEMIMNVGMDMVFKLQDVKYNIEVSEDIFK